MRETPAPEELIQKAQKGDREAFGRLYDLHFDRIYRHIYYRTLHRETAEDLTSQVFLKALDKLDGFRPDRGSFSAWVFGITGNLLIDHFRRKGRTEEVSAVWDLPDGEDFTLDLHNRMIWDQVKPALDNLPPDKRNILILRIWENLSFREIAEVTGKTEGACKMAFARTLEQLREVLPPALLAFIFSVPALLS